MRESADGLTWIGVTFSRRTINNLRYADDIVLNCTVTTGSTDVIRQSRGGL